MSAITLTVNGRSHSLDVDPRHRSSTFSATTSSSVDPSSAAGWLSAGPARADRRRAGHPLLRHARCDRGWSRHHHARRIGYGREPAPDSARFHRGAGRAMRILLERRHLDRESSPRREPEGNRRRNPGGPVDGALPMFRTRSESSSHPPVRQGACGMSLALSRRDFLKGAGFLIVSFSASRPTAAANFRSAVCRTRPARFMARHRCGRPGHRLHG